MKKNKEIVKISESQLRSMIAESVKGILNEIGDTPAGQWMLGRLAGRQRNREHPEEISSYTMPVRKQGKITKTTIDANTYGDNDYDSAFERGRDLENSKWRDDYSDYNQYHADEREESLRGFGDAMASMIRYHKDKALKESVLRKIIAESVKKVLNEGHGWDGMMPGGKVLNGHIKDGNVLVDLKLMCEFLQRYVMPNGEEKDGKFIYRGHAVDVTEFNRCIHEAICYLNDIVKQFGY